LIGKCLGGSAKIKLTGKAITDCYPEMLTSEWFQVTKLSKIIVIKIRSNIFMEVKILTVVVRFMTYCFLVGGYQLPLLP
jgi:hypothetical protein